MASNITSAFNFFFSKDTTRNAIYTLYLVQQLNAQMALEVHGKHYTHQKKVVVFFSASIFAVCKISHLLHSLKRLKKLFSLVLPH